MNLFTVGKTKDGRMTVTFAKTPEAMAELQPIMQHLFNLSIGNALPAATTDLPKLTAPQSDTQPPPPEETRATKRGRPKKVIQTADSVREVAEKLVKDEEKFYNGLTPTNKRWYNERLAIKEAIAEYAQEKYGRKCEHTYSLVYKEMYGTFFEETGYQMKKTTLKPLRMYQPSFLNTIISDNKGAEFLRHIHQKIRKTHIKLVKLNVQ